MGEQPLRYFPRKGMAFWGESPDFGHRKKEKKQAKSKKKALYPRPQGAPPPAAECTYFENVLRICRAPEVGRPEIVTRSRMRLRELNVALISRVFIPRV